MKKIFLLFIYITLSSFTQAQGINFFEGSWHKALLLAQKEKKIIFVDAYTPWCHPCKKLKNEIFPQSTVGDFYNNRFINLSINLEDLRGLVFSLYYKVNAYPTLLFIDTEGNIILESKGFKNVKRLLRLGEIALEKSKNPKSFMYKNHNVYSNKNEKIFKKLKKARSKQDLKKYNKYAQLYFDLLTTDSLKRDFIKSIYTEKNDNNNSNQICYNLSKKLFNENKTKQNNIFLIKILVLTNHYKDAYRRINKTLKKADNNKDIKTRIELRRYKKYLTKKLYSHN